MAASSRESLNALKLELDGLPARPWSGIDAWIAKATSIIRRYFSSETVADFKKAAETPRWTSLGIALGRDEEVNRMRLAEYRATTESSDLSIAQAAKNKLAGFLDGLIAIADEPTQLPKRSPGTRKIRNKQDSQGTTQEERRNMAKKQSDSAIDPRKVFVVHGRNNAAREALFAFLRTIGLHPLEWSEIVQATGNASPYIGEVLAKGFSIAQAVVVLMTPDDEARLREQYRGANEPAHEVDLTAQPRPNVLLEAGMSLGLFPDRTVIVELGRLRPVSDISGRHVIRMNDTTEKRQDLAQRLQTAGCQVNLSGTDWHKAGSFSASV